MQVEHLFYVEEINVSQWTREEQLELDCDKKLYASSLRLLLSTTTLYIERDLLIQLFADPATNSQRTRHDDFLNPKNSQIN